MKINKLSWAVAYKMDKKPDAFRLFVVRFSCFW